ncbi:MAG: NAD(P)H-hydrate epimerase, partial [Vulcanimicrobiaceae bacterium]
MRLLTAAQMRAADAAAVARVGELALMRAAGAAIAEAIAQLAPDACRLVAFAGPGNNGGDAFAAFAAHAALAERMRDGAFPERIVYAEDAPHASAARRTFEREARERGVVTRPLPSDFTA